MAARLAARLLPALFIVAGDCKAEDYPGVVECVDGVCMAL